jgi:hydrogenase maturation protease
MVVIGVGNEYRRDDGAGLAVVTSLRDRVGAGAELVLTDGEPTRLIEVWTGAALAVVFRRRPRRSAPPRPGAPVRAGPAPGRGHTDGEFARVRPG